MKRFLFGAAAAILLAAPSLADGLPVGEKAPWPEGKETINLPAFSAKSVQGKVVLYEVFRTW